MKQGARYLGNNRCEFVTWAPFASEVTVRTDGGGGRDIPLLREERGYWRTVADGIPPGTRYRYLLESEVLRPDPASRLQPEGVHGPSAVVDAAAYRWRCAGWTGIPLDDLIFYELHVGTFTPEGTYRAVIERLPYLRELGITALELMPLSQFPGNRNWGYDGVFPFAPHSGYGSPDDLKGLVDACHEAGIAIFLDVVYNHFGPEGNYLRDYGPYFTPRYRTPWGEAVNFDGEHSDEVRRFFIENARYWLEEFRFDGLRLDAVHGIFDFGANHFLKELADEVATLRRETGREIHLIAESDLNDPRVVESPAVGGYGIDAQWSDDLHHALHALLTGERSGYYADFGEQGHLTKALADTFVLDGCRSRYRNRRHGAPAGDLPPRKFVVCTQNHDQVGNRPTGSRLPALAGSERLKFAAATVILGPYLPLLFMGEEYGETSPFPYFVSHGDPDLVEAVRRGRKEEFPFLNGEFLDPQGEETFQRAKIDTELRHRPHHRELFAFYCRAIEIRKNHPLFRGVERREIDVRELGPERTLAILRQRGNDGLLMLLNPHDEPVAPLVEIPAGSWTKLLDGAAEAWGGPGGAAPDVLTGGIAPLPLPPFGVLLYGRNS